MNNVSQTEVIIFGIVVVTTIALLVYYWVSSAKPPVPAKKSIFESMSTELARSRINDEWYFNGRETINEIARTTPGTRNGNEIKVVVRDCEVTFKPDIFSWSYDIGDIVSIANLSKAFSDEAILDIWVAGFLHELTEAVASKITVSEEEIAGMFPELIKS